MGIVSRHADAVSVLENVFLGGLIGVNELASEWVIAHNVFSGFTLSQSGVGGLAIAAFTESGTRAAGTRIEFNEIDTEPSRTTTVGSAPTSWS